MGTLTFDTLKYSNRLKAANVPAEQAEAEAEALSEILEVNMKELVTKEDLQREIREMELRLTIKLGLIVVGALGAFTALSKWIA